MKYAIPSTWKDVHISKDPTDYIQVTGRDPSGKLQYIYHPLFVIMTTQDKYHKLKTLAGIYDQIEKQVDKDFSKGIEEAILLKIIMLTNIRVGNDKYITNNSASYGLTTLLKKHIKMVKNEKTNKIEIIFRFIGKKQVEQFFKFSYNPLVKFFITRMKLLQPNDRIFYKKCYDINNYIAKLIELKHCNIIFTCKDFRTYGCNKIFINFLKVNTKKILDKGSGIKEIKEIINLTYKQTANVIGHSQAISKKSYIAPYILDKYIKDPITFLKLPLLKIIQ